MKGPDGDDGAEAGTTPRRLAYAPGLDGLRAVACLAVMLFHAGLLHVAGGFLGVTIFLTLSGFLITSLLLDELRGKGRVDLRGFWRRRAHRIIPLLLVVTTTCAVWAMATGSLLARQTIAGAGASLVFGTNWLAASHDMAAGLLNGNWSVAVEEQFYLLWPVALIVLYRRTRSERSIAWCVIGAALAVVLYRSTLGPADWGQVWYSTHTQADALLAGCAVALGMRCNSRAVAIAAGITLASLLLFARPADPATIKMLMPVAAVSTALLIPYLQEHAGMLGWRPLVGVGKRSYGLYLWGCPIVYLAKYVFVLGTVGVVASIGLTFVVTELSYQAVELPMRRLGRRDVASASEVVGGCKVDVPPLAA